jgi:hypothetical protein
MKKNTLFCNAGLFSIIMGRKIFYFYISLFILCISITSIFFTRGNTIFLIAPFFVIYFYFSNKNETLKINRSLLSPILWVFSFILLNGIKYFKTFKLNLNLVDDKGFYAQVSAFLRKTGNETYFFDYSANADRVPIPYHYGENWLTVFFSSVFNINEGIAQELITIPFLIGLEAYFIYETSKLLGVNKLQSVIIAFVVVFFTQIPFIDLNSLPYIGQELDGFKFNYYLMPKYAFSFFISSILLYSLALDEWKVKTNSIFISLFGFICSISFLPICFTLLLIQFIQIKKINYSSIIGVAITLFYFYLFYFVVNHSNKFTSYNTYDSNLFKDCISIGKYFKTIFNISILTTIQVSLVLLPFVIILIVSWLKKIKDPLIVNYTFKKILTISFLAYSFGLIAWAVLWYSLGSISLLIDGGYIFLKTSLILISLIILYHKFNRVKHVILALLFLFSLTDFYKFVWVNNHAELYSDQRIFKKIIPDSKQAFIYFRHYNCSNEIYKINLLAYPQINQLTSLRSNHFGVFANTETIKRSNECLFFSREQNLISSSVYAIYQSENNFKLSDSVLINTFAKKNKINYIISDKDYPLTKENEGLYKYFNYRLEYTTKRFLIYRMKNKIVD